MKHILLIVLVSLLTFGCEDIEDIHKEFKGEGKIRYIGKCENLQVEEGFNRLRLSWENSLDPLVDSLMLVFKTQEGQDTTILSRDLSEYTTESNLGNYDYTIELYSLDEYKNKSLPTSEISRPYTLQHEQVLSIPLGYKKYFIYGNNLFLLTGTAPSDEFIPTISYLKSGENQVIKLDENIFNQGYVCINDIDENTCAELNKKVRITECFDVIEFEPDVLNDPLLVMDNDFKEYLKTKYNKSVIDMDFINSLTELDIDYNLPTLEDILYFTNLNSIRFCKNRYYDASIQSATIGVTDKIDLSKKVLEEFHEYYPNTKIESYNNGYDLGLSFVEDKGKSQEPQKVLITDYQNWEYTDNTHRESYEYDYELEHLFDNNPATSWNHGANKLVSDVSIEINFKEIKTINGFLLRQCNGTDAYGTSVAGWMPPSVTLEYKTNEEEGWKCATKSEIVLLGTLNGEATYIDLEESVNTQYIRLKMSDISWDQWNSGYPNRNLYLGDFLFY